MRNTDKLLSITNLKKYFPVARQGLFQKEQRYVRANEAITLDIYSGETFGLVGESGCGKSTLGRTILQLYDQTAGSTMYYGRSVDDFAPAYVADTLKNAPKLLAQYRKKRARAEQCAKECDAAGEQATFLQHQNKNLSAAEADTALRHLTRLLGGFAALEDCSQGARLLLKRHKTLAALHAAQARLQNGGAESARAHAAVRKLSAELAEDEKRLQLLRQHYAEHAEFAAYEAYRDNGIDLCRLKYGELRQLRKELQIIFQDPYSSLDPRMTVGQIIGEGLVTHRIFKPGAPQMQAYILDVMRQCGLQEHMLHRYPHQFSGGQRQRICIARALAVKPRFIVCDECVSALDVSIQSQIINLLQELKEKEKLTYLFISHDLSVVRYISDRIGVMYLGNIVELGTAREVFSDPRHPYTVALLSAIPTTDADAPKRERILLEGSIPSPVDPPAGCKFHTRCYMACEKCKSVPPPVVEVSKGHFAACHFPDRKLDENGSYLFDLSKKRG